MLRETLNQIRTPIQQTWKKSILFTACAFLCGIVLGIISKWLDNLSLDSTIWWHRPIESLDLGNFFSDIAIWLLAALLIAVFSDSAFRAALNVFLFFAGMCVAYHVYTLLFSGFNPMSYMMIWYGMTLCSPFLAVLCWYAKGSGTIALILNIGIIAVFTLACFGMGFFYVDCRGILYLLVFAGAAAALYQNPKQLLLSLPIGFLLAFLLSPVWPFH